MFGLDLHFCLQPPGGAVFMKAICQCFIHFALQTAAYFAGAETAVSQHCSGVLMHVSMFMHGLMLITWMHSDQARRRSSHAGGIRVWTWSNAVFTSPSISKSSDPLDQQTHSGGGLPESLSHPQNPPNPIQVSIITPQCSHVLPPYRRIHFHFIRFCATISDIRIHHILADDVTYTDSNNMVWKQS